ncbi:MAG: hypothetical protein JSS23_11785 [Proteobacteria bacterium]|nr:hypothetical protein [Pseudomonadota bacterium]
MRDFTQNLALLSASILLVGCISNSQTSSPTATERDSNIADLTRAPPSASTNPRPNGAPPNQTTASSPTEHTMGNDPSQAQADTPRTLTLKQGENARLGDGSHLTYLKLLNDSRCPPDVQCIWAGNAEIQLHWAPAIGDQDKTFPLNTSPVGGKPVSAIIGSSEVRIHSLERGPAPAATLEIKPTTP